MSNSKASGQRRVSQVPAYRMGILMLGSGAGHFAAPARFDAMMPAKLPGNVRVYTHGSGVVEVAIGALLLVPRTRRLGATAAAAFFILVSPAIINGVRLGWAKGWPIRVAAVARLPLQISMITQSFKIRRNA